MKYYKIAVALTEEQYNATKAEWLHRPALTSHVVETPDERYIVVTGDWIALDEDYVAFKREIEDVRHAILAFSEEGDMFAEKVTSDKYGCDEEFDVILGWDVNICLWEDPGQPIV